MKKVRRVSVIIPARNEETYITRCLQSVVNQDYAGDSMEIVVVDGTSEDGTMQRIEDFLKAEGNTRTVRVLRNPGKIVPCGLNIAIKETQGDYIIRMDAHGEYKPNYVSKCVEWLDRTRAECVGGPLRAKGKGFVGEAVALAYASKFGCGGGRFHDGHFSGFADTVFLGAWPRAVFEKYGLFDERLIRNQDIEFNARVRRGAGQIYLTPEIRSYYYCRNTLRDLWRQNFENGRWVVYTKGIASHALSWRHFTPLLFVLSLGAAALLLPLSRVPFSVAAGSYLAANLCVSLSLSVKNGMRYFLILPVVFGTLHLSYGLGSLWGLITCVKWRRQNR